jgi:hypothetical protein
MPRSEERVILDDAQIETFVTAPTTEALAYGLQARLNELQSELGRPLELFVRSVPDDA